MKLHRFHAAALASATIITAGTLAGCVAEVESAPPPALATMSGPAAAVAEVSEGIQALTQRVNWDKVEASHDVPSF